MGLVCQRHASAPLPPGKTRYPRYRRLSGSQGISGRVRKIPSSPEFDPRIVQPVMSRYTDSDNAVDETTNKLDLPIYIYIYIYPKISEYWKVVIFVWKN